MASGMDYALRPGFFKFECRKFDVWFKFELAVRRLSHLTYGFWPGRQLPTHGIPKRLLARTAFGQDGSCRLSCGNSQLLARF